MHIKKVLIAMLMVWMLPACAGADPEQLSPLEIDQQLLTLGVQPYASPTPTQPNWDETGAAEPTPPEKCPAPYTEAAAERTDYILFLYLGLEEHAGYVDERISYPNLTGEALDELLLVVDANWQAGAFSLSALNLAGQAAEGYQLEGGYLTLNLEVPLPAGCSLELHLEYHLELPERAGIFGFTEDQLVLTNWYPFIPPFMPGEGWLVHDPGTYGEYLVYDAADFSVTLELAESSENVLVAAPAPAKQEGSRYRYVLEGARTFSLAVLSGYTVQQEDLNGIKITVYAKRATIREVEAAMSTAKSSLALYERLFGPYPFQSLTIAQLEMYDGMEYDGLFFLSEEVFGTYNWGPRNMLVYLVAHEVSHNWWFSQVANDQAMEPWLDEALGTYCELLFYEFVYPNEVDWWWDFRIVQYEPEGYIDSSIYTYGNYEAYRQAVYLRGVEFLEALREEMGDEAFFSFLRAYIEQSRFRLVTAEDFFSILQEQFSVEVEALRIEYFGGG